MKNFFFLFLFYKLISTQLIQCTNSSLSLNQSALAMTFGLDWVVWATIGPTTGSSLIKMNMSGSTYLNATITAKPIVQLKIYQDTLKNNSLIYVKSISKSFIFQIYRIVNRSTQLKYTFTKGVVAFFFYKSQAAQFMDTAGTANFINLTTYAIISSQILSGNTLLSMNPYSDYSIIFNSYQTLNTARGAYNVLNAYNYSQVLRFNSSYSNFVQCTNSNYDTTNLLYIRICLFRIQVWFVPNNTCMLVKNLIYSLTNCFTNAIVCAQYLIILSQKNIQFYSLSNWSLLFTQTIASLQNYPSFVQNQLKCLTPNKIGFSGISAFSGLKTIYFIDFYEVYPDSINSTSLTPPPNPNPTPNTTNTTTTPNTTTNTTTTPYPNPTPTPPPPSPSPILTQNPVSFFEEVLDALKSQNFNTISINIATLASIFSSTAAFKQILKPFAYLMEELWYYGCHSIRYTDFIDDLSKKADLLNEIKIKPQFFDQIAININYFQVQNNLYLSSSVLNKRSTDQIYSLLSIQDIYTFNLVQGFVITTLFFVLRKLFKLIKEKHKLFSVLYKQFYINSLWWNFLVITIENNIGPITYHCVIQFNCLFSFNFNHKYNHLFSVVAFYGTSMYCYTFYRLLFRYAKKKHSSHLLSVGVFTYLGFWLQTTLTCHRRISVAFAHSWLTNRHFQQMIFLIVCDFIILYIVIKLRKHFRTKFSLLMSWGYFFGFLFFDLGIFIGTQIIFKDNPSELNDNLFFNYYYFILIMFLSLITLLKILNSMVIMMKSIFKKVLKSNQIEQEGKTKKQSENLSDDQNDKQKQKQIQKQKQKDVLKLQSNDKPFVSNQPITKNCKSQGQNQVFMKMKMKIEKSKKTEKNINPNLLKVQSTKKIQKNVEFFQQKN